MPSPTHSPKSFTRARVGSIVLAASLLAGACGATNADSASSSDAALADASTTDAADGPSAETVVDGVQLASGDTALFDSSVVHDIEIAFDQAAYDEMIATYETTGDKDWISATVTIDGTTFDDAGMRLKGNSSLFSLTSETAGDPEALPWLISLDKYVDDQNHQGYKDLVIRSNSTETAMNEAVALELLGLAGLATQEAIATSFTVNGGETELRLAIEHPDEVWEEANFDSDDALLYKADSEGDYSYRGDDPDAYDDVFNQKVGDDDLEPLIEFLDFINNSDDAAFAADLASWLDVDAFATYLAFQELIDNFDDIDGPGNNSYLHYDADTEQFTVVSWDLNLAFGTANVGGPGDAGGRGGPGGGGDRPAGGGGPGGQGDNVLSTRFLADADFAALYQQTLDELTEALFSSGAATEVVEQWVDTLTAATDLVPTATVESEAGAIAASFPAG